MTAILKHLFRKPLPIAKTLPLDVGPIHFVGIGGIGMSGIAEVLHNLGYVVQGSDIADSANTQRLRALGITVHIGHAAGNIDSASVVVVSSAVKEDNPEVVEARNTRVPVVRRAEMLAELMRLKMSVAVAGTHGKTTTTALTAAIFEAAGLQPTVINGGIINARGTNAYLGGGEWMVVEADESDGTFIKVPSTIGIITNIDPEHLEHYGSFEGVKQAFHTFITNLPFYGFAVACIDHPEVQALVSRVTDRRVITYGFSPQADVRAVNIRSEVEGQRYDIEIRGRDEVRTLKDVFLAMHGRHNVSNSLASVAVGLELGMADDVIYKAFERFGGVKRRFTKTGEGRGITVIDDYGHHPVEISATLKAARYVQDERKGRVIAIVQPHRYTRLRDLMNEFCTCFNDADAVIVADVYTAGEAPIEGVDADKLAEGLKRAGHKQVLRLSAPEDLARLVAEVGREGDMAVCLGAGSITKWAYALPEELEKVVG